MSKNADKVKTHFDTMSVQVKPASLGGLGLHDTDSLDRDAVYTVIATYVHVHDDRSREPAFLISTPEGIVARTCTLFKVAEHDRPAAPARPMIDVDLYAADCVNSIGDVLYDPKPDVDGYGPDELREEVESSVRYTLRKLMTALGYHGDGTATLRVSPEMGTRLRQLRKLHLALTEYLDPNPATLQPKDDEERQEFFEEQSEIEMELTQMLFDLIPTMEVYN